MVSYPVKQTYRYNLKFFMTVCITAIMALGMVAWPAHAARPPIRFASLEFVGQSALGLASGFVAHESGHLSMNAALGNRPTFRRIRGVMGIPFLAISPDIHCTDQRCTGAQGQPFLAGTRGRTAIAAAGFFAQHITSEAILTLSPHVLYESAPLLQAWLFFNTSLSVAYAISCWTGIESDYGDAGGIAVHARLPRAVVATGLLCPALLDVARAVWPSQRWIAWASRASKAGFVALTLAH